MADDKNIRGPVDASRINIHEDYEAHYYWTHQCGFTTDQLAACVRSAGVVVVEVKRCLGASAQRITS
jgi:hypothetical protein